MSNPNGTTGTTGSTVGANIDQKIDELRERARGFVDQGSERVDRLRSRMMDARDRACSKGSALLDRTTDMIKAHPLKSIGIAFGAGYIGMRLFRR
jgi:ElaB/YqjD/DUF883 family membrane-anchored ribosome-binding protein